VTRRYPNGDAVPREDAEAAADYHRRAVSDEDRSRGSLDLSASRLEAFSDAVMAVIITIMAFGLRPPKFSTLPSLEHRLPNLLVYMLSFAFIAIYWNNHHHLLRATDRISGAVMWANSFLLFWLSLMPVLTEWLARDYELGLPAAAYGVVALAAAFSYTLLVRALIRANGRDSLVATAISSDVKGYASLGMYAAGVGLAFVSPWISYALYAAVSVLWWIPDRRFTRSP
jgi:uncharacterized membrane protein